jgi:hypothetical protein
MPFFVKLKPKLNNVHSAYSVLYYSRIKAGEAALCSGSCAPLRLRRPQNVLVFSIFISPREKKLLAVAGSLRRFLQSLFPFTSFVYLSVGILLLGFTAGFKICLRLR